MKNKIESISQNFFSFLFKPVCPLCQRTGKKLICEYCERKLLSCELPQHHFKVNQNYFLFIWGHYENYLKRAIFSFKYDRTPELGQVFGELLAQSWAKNNLVKNHHQITIVPIPLHPQKLKERGFNQGELIANSFCKIMGYQHLPNLLTRVKNTDAMFGLNATQRQANITQAFTLGKDYPKFNRQHSVIILDDIYTTGATVEEAIKVFNTLQIKVIGVIAIASSIKSD